MSTEFERKAQQLFKLQAEFDALKAEVEALKDEFKAEMNDCDIETMFAGEYQIDWKRYSRRDFDTSSFKKEYPELYEKFKRENESRRFSIKRV